MANTIFLSCTNISQTTGAEEISWNLDTSPTSTNSYCVTSEPLTSFNGKQTGQLNYSNFFSDNTIGGSPTIDGIEVKIESNKANRIIDSIIQLTKDGSLIGNNKAVTDSAVSHTYGGPTDKWGTTLTYNDLITGTGVGVAIKYKSDTVPHKDICKVWNAKIKIYYTP